MNRMTDRDQALATLLFPHVEKTIEDWLAHYPPRSLSQGAYVTRYAPSPTGFVHIGSIYASLVSSRIAHQSGGIFFLRIEDTDKKREKDGSIEAIVRNMINFGLSPDEGIVQIDPEEREIGAYAPYTQSERVPMYESFARTLVARGLAYPAFDTEAELDSLRRQQEAQRVRPGYYGVWARWREASLEKIQERLAAGERPVIRVRAPFPNEARVKIRDLIKGDLDLPANDTDAVILKSNALPTYHFAHVVDDTLMRVNLITRGDEWLPSLPLHVQLFEFTGQTVPQYAHIAPIAKIDGSSKRKLSKRKDPEADMTYYYTAGYPERAVTEYLLNLANSRFEDWRKAHPTTPNTEFEFRLEDMGKSSPLFDIVKLNDISKNVVATYTAEQVYETALAWAKANMPDLADLLERERAYSLQVFNVERSGDAPRKDIVNWSDIERACGFFFDELFDASIAVNGYPFPNIAPSSMRQVIDAARGFDPATPKEQWIADMRALAERLGFARDAKTFKQDPAAYHGHFGDMMMVIRVALTGKTSTPDLYEILQTYGAERTQRRFELAHNALNEQPSSNVPTS
jgi:glutamyl-tRNA synthetase